ncbi:uncharacterized protein LOC128226009 [Mya arenaria]|uniref:uncharacterized protein LOC128226009 n=1 Tax=Mya arenaria TaxID=6604 RepID=UPI0022E45087|nr:uncharacterized protein LOC128226009 [Mya arenaria]
MARLLACVLAFLCAGFIQVDARACVFKDASTGKTYDFTQLINPAGYYMFKQQIWEIGGFSLDSLVADTQVNATFYVQVCQNILTPPPTCKDVGAIYSITADGTCTSWGDANVSVFVPNPYKDGVHLKMYHGSTIDHLSNNAASIYFVCNQGNRAGAEAPTFEHVKAAINQAHFKFFTHLAC